MAIRGAGILFYDKTRKKILLVQSRGRKWGPAKGHFDTTTETPTACASREAYEETGIKIEETFLTFGYRVFNYKIYFVPVSSEEFVNFDNLDKEITNIRWFSVQELKRIIPSQQLNMNRVGIFSIQKLLLMQRWEKKGFILCPSRTKTRIKK